jgi:hypothetical protein
MIIFTVLSVLLLALVFSCGEPPTGVKDKPGNGGGMSGSGEIDPGATGSFLLGTVSDSLFAAGYVEVWASNVAFDSATGMVTFDITLKNSTEWPIEPAVHFVITSINPSNIAVVDFDGESSDGFPFYDFSEKLGPDNILEVGETTDPVTAKFHVVHPRSFSIGFRIDLLPQLQGATIAGVVFQDNNKNGVRDRCKDDNRNDLCFEPGIPDITVSVDLPMIDGTTVHLITRTDQNGEYSFTGFQQGVYKVWVHAPDNRWEITSPNPLLVTLLQGTDGKVQDFYGANFGLYPLFQPGEETLFGPVLVGPVSPFGTLLDSTFIDPPSVLPVVQYYYLEVAFPLFAWPIPGVIDTASAWVNDIQVFSYGSPEPPDSIVFMPGVIKLPDGLVHYGENKIRLFADGDEHSALMYRVFKKP